MIIISLEALAGGDFASSFRIAFAKRQVRFLSPFLLPRPVLLAATLPAASDSSIREEACALVPFALRWIRKRRCTVSRKLIVLVGVALILALAGLPSIVAWLDHVGLIDWARWARAEYVTGTAIAVILALLILLPDSRSVPRQSRIGLRHCPVCEAPLTRPGRYCPACGSRI